jgi:hypothetical protein
MDVHKSSLDIIQDKASQRILFSQHALRQMSRPDRMISTTEIRIVLDKGEIIEDYPEDPRGHSCLLLGKGFPADRFIFCVLQRMSIWRLLLPTSPMRRNGKIISE